MTKLGYNQRIADEMLRRSETPAWRVISKTIHNLLHELDMEATRRESVIDWRTLRIDGSEDAPNAVLRLGAHVMIEPDPNPMRSLATGLANANRERRRTE